MADLNQQKPSQIGALQNIESDEVQVAAKLQGIHLAGSDRLSEPSLVRFHLGGDPDTQPDGTGRSSESSIPILTHIINKLPHLNLSGKITFDPVAVEKGGYADVHRGLLKQDDKQDAISVAVKRLRYKIEDRKVAKGVAREMRIWSEFEHPNVLKLEGYIMEHAFPALISKWMERGSLWQYMKKHIVTSKEAISLVSDIAQGLAYVHGKDAIHSDLKSDNVLISPDKRALLTDFGISRMESLTNGYTMTRGNKGTARWQAVEFLNINDLGDGSETSLAGSLPTHTKQTDVWAFGMTVYEVLTNDRPYAQIGSDVQIIVRLMQGKYPPKPAFSNIPADALIEHYMWSICERCRETDPSSRPSMADLETELGEKLTEFESEL